MKIALVIGLCLLLHAAVSFADDDDNSHGDSSGVSDSISGDGGSSSTSSSEIITNHFTSVDMGRHEGESEEEYYRRLVVRYESESSEEHEVRISFLKLLLPNLPIWKDNRYKQYVSTTTRLSRSSKSSFSSSSSTASSSSSSTSSTTASGSTTTSGSRVVMRRSASQTTQMSELHEYEREQTETEEEYYKRILTKRSSETGEEYLQRIAKLRKLKPELAIWKEEKFLEFMKSHIVTSSSKIVTRRKLVNVKEKYLSDIQKRSDETEEVYYRRIFKRQADESVKEYQQRIKEMRKRMSDLEVWKNSKYKKYVSQYISKTSSTSKRTSKSTTNKAERSSKVVLNTKYLTEIEQRSGETKEEYYKRIFRKYSDEDDRQYKKRIQVIKKRLPKLDVWKNNKYRKYTKEQTVTSKTKRSTIKVKEEYLKNTERRSSESEETYYRRIFRRYDDETSEEYRMRIKALKQKLPYLEIWKDNQYEKYTSAYSSRVVVRHLRNIYRKEEESEEEYYERIFRKHEDECKTQYMKRIEELKTELPDLPVWKNNAYEKYTSVYLSSSQTKRSSMTTKTTEETTSTQKTFDERRSEQGSSAKVVGRRSLGHEQMEYKKVEEDKKRLKAASKVRESNADVKQKNKESNDDDNNSSESTDGSTSDADTDSDVSSSSKSSSEAITDYFTSVDVSRHEGESEEEYYRRLVVRYQQETDEDYEVRISFLKVLLPKLSIWTENKYKQYETTQKKTTKTTTTTTTTTTTEESHVAEEQEIYKEIERYESETEEEYYKRILTKRSRETGEQYLKRIAKLRKLKPELEIWKEQKFTEFMKTHIVTSSSKIATRRKVVDVKQEYLKDIQKRSDETEEVYYKRIFKRHAEESVKEYKQRVKEMKKRVPQLKIWKNDEFKKYMSQYTSRTTSQKSSRTVSKRETKSEITVNAKYLSEIEQRSSESREEYYKRIFQKYSDEDDRQYKKRIQEIKKRKPDLDVWKSDVYKKYTKKYTSKSKRSTVTVNEKYLKEIQRKDGESEETFYKRMFRRHSDESKEQYWKRIDVLKTKLPHLEVWKDNLYKQYTSVYSSRVVTKYMKNIYRKKEESEEEYYERIFRKHEDECKTQYMKRIEELKIELPDLPVWKNNAYEKYTSVYLSSSQTKRSSMTTKTTEETTSTQKTFDERRSEQGSSAKVVGRRSLGIDQTQYEKVEEDKKRLKAASNLRESNADVENKKKESNDDDNNSSESTDGSTSDADTDSDVSSSSKSSSEAITDYFTSVDVSRHEGESEEEYYRRLVVRYQQETDEDYEVRISFLKVLLPKLSIWTENKYKQYETTQKKTTKTTTTTTTTTTTEESHVAEEQEIYKEFERLESETEEEYYKRILTKRSRETGEEYLKRIAKLRKLKPELEIWKEQKFTEFMKTHIVTSSSKIATHRKVVDVKKEYLKDIQKRSDETEEVYYKRIFKKHAEESVKEYKQRVKEMKKRVPHLKIWKNDEFKKYMSQYTSKTSQKSSRTVSKRETKSEITVNTKYLSEIEQRSSESKEEYYKRIFQKYSDEDDRQYKKRIQEIKKRKPDLDVWKSDLYKKYTKKYTSKSKRSTVTVNEKYLKDIQRKESESVETYYKRIFRRHSDESKEQYWKRIDVLKTKLPHLEVWKDNLYEEYTSVYSSRVITKYMGNIQKEKEESEESYYKRIFKKYEDESKTQYTNRIEEMKKELPHLSVWKNDEYLKYSSVHTSSSKKTSSTSRSLSTSSASSASTSFSTSSSTQSSSSVNVVEKYLTNIERFEGENKETYYRRIFKKHEDESNYQYRQRIEEMRKRLYNLDVWKNEEFKQYTEFHEASSNTVAKSIAQQDSSTKAVSRRSQSESKTAVKTDHAASRIEKRSVTMKNTQVKHLNEIRRKDEENEEVYYRRILQKYSDETDDEYEERINVMKERLSDLAIWKNNQYRKYQNSVSSKSMSTSSSSSSYYSSSSSSTSSTSSSSEGSLKYMENIEKQASESEQDYYTRILRKHSDESDEEYSQRLQLMMQKLSHLSIWKNNEYVKYQETKQYSESKRSVSQVSYTEVVQDEHQEEHHVEQEEIF